jgi:hypothetical protein
MALVLAAIIFVITLVLAAIVLAGDGMSDSPTTSVSPWPVLVGGSLIALAIAASHWMPHVGW